MAGPYITKSVFESLCCLRGRVDCLLEFTKLMPDDVQYSGVFRSFSSIIDDSLERLERDFSSLHLALKQEDEKHD